MHPIILISALSLAAPISAAPFNTPEVTRPVVNAFKIAASRLLPSARNEINRAIEIISEQNISHLTLDDATVLIKAAQRGDVRAINALNYGMRNWLQEGAGWEVGFGANEVLKHYPDWRLVNGEVVTSFEGKFKENGLHSAVVGAKDFASVMGKTFMLSWHNLSPAAKWTIIGLAIFDTAEIMYLGEALDVTPKDGSGEYNFPDKLTHDEMKKLKTYIAEHPDRYQSIVAGVSAKIPNLTDQQKEELMAAAPQGFTPSFKKNSKRSLDELD